MPLLSQIMMAPRAENKSTEPLASPNGDDSSSFVPGTVRSPERGSWDDDDSSVRSQSSHSHSSASGLENEFFDTRFVDFSRELGYITKCWNIILGLSALLDFLAATVDSKIRRDYVTWETERYDPWLRRNSFQLGMIFSGLWFVDSFITATQSRNRTLRRIERARLLREEGWENKTKNAEWKALRDFLLAMTMQLLLLPIGFYIWIAPADSLTLTVEHDKGTSYFDETETFRSTSNVSLVYAMLRYAVQCLSELLRREAVQHGKKSAFRWLRRRVRHPVQLARTISKITKWIRWVRVIGPVIGTSNKLLGNSIELYKKFKQRREAVRAAKIRRTLWLHMTDEEAREHAATLAQKVFRAKKARREMRALQLLQGNRERLAAMGLQKRFRAALKRARKRIARRKRELEKLERKAEKANMNRLKESEKIRMYMLQSELAKDADRFINRNLLRPNTTFSVIWRSTFVLSVILELTTLILRINYPGLNKEALLPVPFSELKECRQAEANRFEKWLAALRGYQEVPQARYCEDDMVALQAFGIGLMKLLFEGVILMVNFVFFFDVPVSFFTGQFNPDNGILEPKPFFPRWIVPGVLLQMIVNPQMDTVAEIIATIVSKIRDLGPIRVFRWTVALFFPMSLYLVGASSRLWAKFVTLQNTPEWRIGKAEPGKKASVEENAPRTMTRQSSLGELRLSMVRRSEPKSLHAMLGQYGASN